MALQIYLNGSQGRMGQTITGLAPEFDAQIAVAVDAGIEALEGLCEVDVVIDFSVAEATLPLAEAAHQAGKPMVIGTTGHPQQVCNRLVEIAGELPLVWAGNFSAGVTLLNHLVRTTAHSLGPEFAIEVIESHHRHKRDAPSGTAAHLVKVAREARGLPESAAQHGREGLVGARPVDEIGVHAIRGGDIVGEHTVLFAGEGERLELTHRATDRAIFARGALRAARWLAQGKPAGLYGMEDVLGLSNVEATR